MHNSLIIRINILFFHEQTLSFWVGNWIQALGM